MSTENTYRVKFVKFMGYVPRKRTVFYKQDTQFMWVYIILYITTLFKI